jgi:glycosyltransferase involved in cell wall biosynthesis
MLSELPFVTVCTPTFNRRPFIENMFEMFRRQDYPKDKLEWVIIDDGSDKIEDLIKTSGIDNIKYVSREEKMTLGAKRNLMHSEIDSKCEILVYFDDDVSILIQL